MNNKIEGTTYPPHVAFGGVLWVVLSLALVVAAWWYAGWIAAGVALVWTLVSHVVGVKLAQWEIRADGYILEKRKDMRGKMRWRVGTQEPAARVEPAVRWLVPGERGEDWRDKLPPGSPPPPPPITEADMNRGRS